MLRDIRFAFRTLRQNPGFSLVTIVSLALGIGATSAIFAMAEALLLRPLAVPEASHIMVVESQVRGEGVTGIFSSMGVSYPDFKDIREKSKSFSGVTESLFSTFGFAAERGALPKARYGEMVSGDFFRVMRVAPALGRDFRPDEDLVPGRDAVVVLGHELWKNEFSSSPNVVGRTIFLNTIPFTVIGVAPEGFTGSDALVHSALFVPMAMEPRMVADPKQSGLENRNIRDLTVEGRLKPGVSFAQAAAEVRGIGQQLALAYPDTNRACSLLLQTYRQATLEQDSLDVTLMSFLLALAVVVLLIACANVMNLLLSRARARSREIAVRLAIGAGRVRLVRQLLTESALIALAGGTLGLLVAQAGVAFFARIPIPTDIPVVLDMRLDSEVLLFALIASAASALVFGLAPALQSTRPDLVPALKSGRAEGGKRRRFLGRNALVIGQIAGSLLLLVFATQAYRGASILLSSPLGFRTDHLLMAGFNPSLARYKPDQTRAFYQRLLEQTRDLHGVRGAALAQTVPLMPGNLGSSQVIPEGYHLPPGTQTVSVLSDVVSDAYFRTVGMPIVQGREFQVTDRADSPRVAIVNEQFARKYFPNRNAVGKRLRLDSASSPEVEIVGVAKQSRYVFPAEPVFEFLYLPLSQNPHASMTLMLHTAGPSGSLAEPLRNLVRSLDESQPIITMRTMEDFYEQRARGTMQILIDTIGGLGLLGLMLALVGLYGLMAYSVGLRQREIGIRMAIGADQGGVRRMILKQGMTLAITGCGIGLVLTLFAGRPATAFIGSSYFYLPLVAVIFIAMLAVAALSAYFPARRASLLDPNRILRQE